MSETMKKQIGILGTGRMGVRLARLLAAAGHDVVLGSRDPARAAEIARGMATLAAGEPAAPADGRRAQRHAGATGTVTGGSYADAAAAAVVLPAMFLRDGMLDTLEPLRAALDGKLVIDISNPFNDRYDDFILPWNTSGAEQLQHRFPRARVVGAFKNVWWEVFDRPTFDGGNLSDVYVVSDDAAAKAEFFRIVDGTPFRYVDAGPLANARYVERMTLFIAGLGQRLGYFPRMNWRIVGEPWTPGAADELAALIARN
jgi:predicted dinucleotide-binding enzyme